MSLLNHKHNEQFVYQFVFRVDSANVQHVQTTGGADANNNVDFFINRTFPSYIRSFRVEVVDIATDRAVQNDSFEWRCDWNGVMNYDSSNTNNQSMGIIWSGATGDIDGTMSGVDSHKFMIENPMSNVVNIRVVDPTDGTTIKFGTAGTTTPVSQWVIICNLYPIIDQDQTTPSTHTGELHKVQGGTFISDDVKINRIG